jgi:hypothetical protein
VVEVPEEVAALLKREPLLRLAVAEAVRKEVVEYLSTVLALDKLTEGSSLDEETVMRLDRVIKRRLREKWDAESRSRH